MPTGQKNHPSLHSPRRKLIRSSCSLAVQQPYNPVDPAQSQLNQIIQTQLSAAEQKIDLQLADPGNLARQADLRVIRITEPAVYWEFPDGFKRCREYRCEFCQ